jgi:hypothetical protein
MIYERYWLCNILAVCDVLSGDHRHIAFASRILQKISPIGTIPLIESLGDDDRPRRSWSKCNCALWTEEGEPMVREVLAGYCANGY